MGRLPSSAEKVAKGGLALERRAFLGDQGGTSCGLLDLVQRRWVPSVFGKEFMLLADAAVGFKDLFAVGEDFCEVCVGRRSPDELVCFVIVAPRCGVNNFDDTECGKYIFQLLIRKRWRCVFFLFVFTFVVSGHE